MIKFLEGNLEAPWISITKSQNFWRHDATEDKSGASHLIVVKIFQSGPKWWADRHFHPFAHTASKSGWHPWNPWILTWVNNWDSKYVQPCCLWALTSNRLKCQRSFYLFIVIFRCKHLVCDYCVVCLLERITAAVDSVNETALHVVKLFYIVDGYYFS